MNLFEFIKSGERSHISQEEESFFVRTQIQGQEAVLKIDATNAEELAEHFHGSGGRVYFINGESVWGKLGLKSYRDWAQKAGLAFIDPREIRKKAKEVFDRLFLEKAASISSKEEKVLLEEDLLKDLFRELWQKKKEENINSLSDLFAKEVLIPLSYNEKMRQAIKPSVSLKFFFEGDRVLLDFFEEYISKHESLFYRAISKQQIYESLKEAFQKEGDSLYMKEVRKMVPIIEKMFTFDDFDWRWRKKDAEVTFVHKGKKQTVSLPAEEISSALQQLLFSKKDTNLISMLKEREEEKEALKELMEGEYFLWASWIDLSSVKFPITRRKSS